jgi:hypothetical protein
MNISYIEYQINAYRTGKTAAFLLDVRPENMQRQDFGGCRGIGLPAEDLQIRAPLIGRPPLDDAEERPFPRYQLVFE